MRRSIAIILGIAGAVTWAAPASADRPYHEHLHIGGGYQETVPGDGGIDLEADGDILMDGTLGMGGTPPGIIKLYIPNGSIVLGRNEYYGVNTYYDSGWKFAQDGPSYGGYINFILTGGGTLTTSTNSGNAGDTANMTNVLSWTAPGVVTVANDLFVDGGDFVVGTAAAGNIGTTTNPNQIQLLTATTGALEGAWDIGDGTNDLLIAADGFTTLAGTARAVMEMKFDALQLLGPGPGSPPAGPLLTGHTFTLNFDPAADEEVFLTMELAHNWDVGTDIKVNFHWAPIDNGAGTVTWGVETKIITPESDLITEASAATQIVTDDTQTTEDELLESDMITIDLSGASIGDFIAMRIFRDADASEGDADDDYASDAQLVGFHVEYIVDSFGTDEVW